ncbi:DUF3343 domain-containing protein [Curtanaerobium respiraculi]|uniref:DUF3343 domain-containing protein n=1 Tax=Curtanaerobium respiraculi TaxID=2949669 RepID=UPI0024B339C4|nr:DUF3343 domain-containing protein [Curtanaerobium respiraculi]
MRSKQPYIVVSFHTTNDAMAVQEAAKRAGLAGRLAPIPRQISAGCGLAWIEPAVHRARIMRLVEEGGLEHAGIDMLNL